MEPSGNTTEYRYHDAAATHAHAYLLPAVDKILLERKRSFGARRVFDVGCGNGFVADHLRQLDFDVTGVDSSTEGIEHANTAYPELKLYAGSAYDNLAAKYGRFPVVISLEVIEHVYWPRAFAKTIFDLVATGGIAVVTTPYHGYLKNLALAVTGQMDRHFTALWDHGHIKFWSRDTLQTVLTEAGFSHVEFHHVGRIPPLAKSMIAVAYRAE